MPATFLQQKKIQRRLIVVLAIVVLVSISVIWWGFFLTAPSPEATLPSPKKVDINTSILSHPLLQELDEPRAKTQIPLEVGRSNPLLPSLQ
ncbi:MAG: hypothetical protein Q8P55_00450 [bacterium]|nr:hypothetical protein [bacterium]